MRIQSQSETYAYRLASGINWNGKPVRINPQGSAPLEPLWNDYQDWHNTSGQHGSPHDSVQGWSYVEDYLHSRHGLSADQNPEHFFNHPVTFGMAKIHSLAQARPNVDGYGSLDDDDLAKGAAMGLLKIRSRGV